MEKHVLQVPKLVNFVLNQIHTGIHSDENANGWNAFYHLTHEIKNIFLVSNGVLYTFHLDRNNGKHFHRNTIKFYETQNLYF